MVEGARRSNPKTKSPHNDATIVPATKPSSVSSAVVPPATRIQLPGDIKVRDRGRLPHWEREGGKYFITFRLADSLPNEVLERIDSERQSILRTAKQMGRGLTASERGHLEKLSSKRIEEYLDSGSGKCWFLDHSLAQLMAETIRYFHGKRYRLLAWCIMPNHVHILAQVFPEYGLAQIAHSWKSFSAKAINRVLKRKGEFWQREYYDHLIRDQNGLAHAVTYIVENPAKQDSRIGAGFGYMGERLRRLPPRAADPNEMPPGRRRYE
jgi:REP element-mobilizing transposase RayT